MSLLFRYQLIEKRIHTEFVWETIVTVSRGCPETTVAAPPIMPATTSFQPSPYLLHMNQNIHAPDFVNGIAG